MGNPENKIDIPAGTEIRLGPSYDSECFVLSQEIKAETLPRKGKPNGWKQIVLPWSSIDKLAPVNSTIVVYVATQEPEL